MNIDFQGQGFLLPAALTDHARRSVHFALMHRIESIQRIVICLGGANGRRDHNDMYCLMQVHLSDALVATVAEIGPDIHDVIDRTTDRVGRVVVTLLDQVARNRRNVGSSANASPRQVRAASSYAERSERARTQPPSCATVQRARPPSSVSHHDVGRRHGTGRPDHIEEALVRDRAPVEHAL